MMRYILIALALLLVLTGPVAAQEKAPLQAVSAWSLSGSDKGGGGLFKGINLNPDDGETWKGKLAFTWIVGSHCNYGWADAVESREGYEVPVRYIVSWTSANKWLKNGAKNPKHRRRGNLTFDALGRRATYNLATSFNLSGIVVAVPPGKKLRVRVRPIYADGTRGKDAVVKLRSESRKRIVDDQPLASWRHYGGSKWICQ